jgi:hypothetical protein
MPWSEQGEAGDLDQDAQDGNQQEIDLHGRRDEGCGCKAGF